MAPGDTTVGSRPCCLAKEEAVEREQLAKAEARRAAEHLRAGRDLSVRASLLASQGAARSRRDRSRPPGRELLRSKEPRPGRSEDRNQPYQSDGYPSLLPPSQLLVQCLDEPPLNVCRTWPSGAPWREVTTIDLNAPELVASATDTLSLELDPLNADERLHRVREPGPAQRFAARDARTERKLQACVG